MIRFYLILSKNCVEAVSRGDVAMNALAYGFNIKHLPNKNVWKHARFIRYFCQSRAETVSPGKRGLSRLIGMLLDLTLLSF